MPVRYQLNPKTGWKLDPSTEQVKELVRRYRKMTNAQLEKAMTKEGFRECDVDRVIAMKDWTKNSQEALEATRTPERRDALFGE